MRVLRQQAAKQIRKKKESKKYPYSTKSPVGVVVEGGCGLSSGKQ